MSTQATASVESAAFISGSEGFGLTSLEEEETKERLLVMKMILGSVMQLRPKDVGFVELEVSLYYDRLIIPYMVRAYYAKDRQSGGEFVSDLEVLDQRLNADRRVELRLYRDGNTSFTHDSSVHASELRQIAEKLQKRARCVAVD